MAKGDHERVENRIDEQMMQSQSYLTMLQQMLGNQYGNLNSMYMGPNQPTYGSIYGWGTTVPHYSPYGPLFSGNGTGTSIEDYYNQASNRLDGSNPTGETAVPRRGLPSGSGATSVGGSALSADAVEAQLMPYLQSLGAANPQALERAMPGIQQMFPGAQLEDSDEIIIPGFGRVDVGTSFEGNDPSAMRWGFMHNPQFDADMGNGQYGYGGGSSAFGNGVTANGGRSGVGGNSFAGGILGQNLGDYGNIMSRYQQFADTGGLSDMDKAQIRSRAISPIRSIYSNARQGLDRQRALQGGYSPGFATALNRFSREQGQLTSDATTNAEAAIAEMTQRGKLAGMGGMASMYGATPGLSNMMGQQSLQASGQQLQAAQLQNQLGLGMIGAQTNLGDVAGTYQNALNNVGGTVKTVYGAIYPWLNSGGSGV